MQWFIPTKTLSVKTSVIAAFKSRQGENIRPTFQLGRRELQILNPEADDHWTYRGPRGASNWGAASFPWLPYTSCGKPDDCEQWPDQESRDKCIADQKMQSPIDIFTNECQPNVDYGGKACVEQIGLRPLHWNVGNSMLAPVKIYLKDCHDCLPCNK